jgi:hypothetical protein
MRDSRPPGEALMEAAHAAVGSAIHFDFVVR